MLKYKTFDSLTGSVLVVFDLQQNDSPGSENFSASRHAGQTFGESTRPSRAADTTSCVGGAVFPRIRHPRWLDGAFPLSKSRFLVALASFPAASFGGLDVTWWGGGPLAIPP